jgi:hypothetical protein
MKILFTIIATCLIFYAAAANVPNGGAVSGNAKEDDLFIVKTARKLVGATVEIYSDDGVLVTAQFMVKRKMVIDFRAMTSGAYTIKVVKGDVTHEFHFVKQ